jgi:nucleotide-binding universal stress UspA family protein
MKVHLAYDGSLNGDWVSRHAMRLASNAEPRRLRVVHVPDGSLDADALEQRLARIEGEAAARGVEVERAVSAPARDVFRALCALLPSGDADLVVCGTRVRPKRGFLSGTISQRLLRQRARRVVAVRVVQPGLLGDPRSFQIPISGRPGGGVATAFSLFRLFLRGAERVALLHVVQVGGLRLPRFSHATERALRARGWEQLRGVMERMKRELPEEDLPLDGRVVLSDDWPHEILIHASQVHARMILMCASDRTLFRRAFDDPLERVLSGARCDVGICRAP